MAIDPRNDDLDELRAASGGPTVTTEYPSGLHAPVTDVDTGLAPDDHRVSLHYVSRLASLNR